MKTNKLGYKTSFMERLSYGGFFAGQNIIFVMVIQFLSIFYTDEVGLTTASVALLFMVARIWDAINDPILGSIIDRTQPKKGKFLPWVKSVTFLLPLFTCFVFIKVGNGGAISLVYAYVSYIIFGMLYTISDVPIFALSTSMTDNSNERVSIISIGRLAAGIGVLFTSVISAPLIVDFGYTYVTIGLMVVSMILMLPIGFLVKERVIFKEKKKHTLTLKSSLKYIKGNKYFIAFYAAYFISGTFGFHKVLMAYFAKWNLGDMGFVSIIAFTIILPLVVLPIFIPRLVRKHGKIKLLKITFIIRILVGVIIYFSGYSNLTLFLVLNTIRSFSDSVPGIMLGMITTDCLEYGTYVSGERHEALMFSVQTFSIKLITAFSGALGVLFLGFYGYGESLVTQSQQTLDGIWVLITIVPVVGSVIGYFIISKFYKLNESDVQNMIVEMKEKAAEA